MIVYTLLIIDCNHQILSRAFKFASQQLATNRPRIVSRNIMSWGDVMSELQLTLKHLHKLGYPLMQVRKDLSDPYFHEYIWMFDPSRSISKKLEEWMLKIVFD